MLQQQTFSSGDSRFKHFLIQGNLSLEFGSFSSIALAVQKQSQLQPPGLKSISASSQMSHTGHADAESLMHKVLALINGIFELDGEPGVPPLAPLWADRRGELKHAVERERGDTKKKKNFIKKPPLLWTGCIQQEGCGH